MGSFKSCKNITVFESITDRKTRVSRDAQNVCMSMRLQEKEFRQETEKRGSMVLYVMSENAERGVKMV